LDSPIQDESGNLILLPGTFVAEGVSVVVSAGVSGDFEVILYSDPLGTPVAERTVTVDGTQLGSTQASVLDVLFPTRFNMKANTPYAITCRPTTTNNITLYYYNGNSVAGSGIVNPPNNTAYAIKRIDNTGAFSDYNGGTAKTRLMKATVLGAYMDQGVNQSFNQLGI
jgi:hypothetical protein